MTQILNLRSPRSRRAAALALLVPALALGTTARGIAASRPDRGAALAAPLDRDGDGRIGEDAAILARIRAYHERHGEHGRLSAAALLERSRWGYSRWLADVHNRLAKGVQGEGWVSLGPVNGAGRCTAVVPHPTLEGTLLAGAAGGGVWRTRDGGQSWEPLTDGLSDLSVGAIAYAPSDPEVVYLGTGEGGLAIDFIPGIGLLRSDDGGDTWLLPAGDDEIVASQFFALSVHPSDPDSLLAATEQGLLASGDGGATWEVRIPPSGLLGVTEVVRSRSDANLVYAAAWCEQACPEGTGRVMRSEDGGETWQPVVTGLPTPSSLSIGFNRNSLAVAPSNDRVLYAGLNTGDFAEGEPVAKIYRSDDGGASWIETADPSPYLGFQGWYDNTISVRPDDPNVVVAGGVYYVASRDGGATWTVRDPYAAGDGLGTATIPHVDGHDLQWQGSTLWLACDGGIWRSLDDGVTWSGRNTGLVTRQYYAMALDPMRRERVLGGTQDNSTNLRRDAGDDTWDVVIGGDGFECAINPLLPDIMYGTVQYGLVFRNTEGGAGAWSEISPLASEDAYFITPLTMRPEAPWVLYTGTTRVWRTSDAGDSWAALPTVVANGGWNTVTVRSIAVTPDDPNVLMVAKGRDVYRSSDGGATWRVSFLGASVNHLEISPFDDQSALAALARVGSASGQLMRTTNGGVTWLPSGAGLPPFAVQVTRWDPTDPSVVYAGTDVGLYRSTDGGSSWRQLGDGLPAASVHDLRILPDGSMLRVATHGRGMWELEIPRPSNQPPTVRITSPADRVQATAGDHLELVAEAVDGDGDQVALTWVATDGWRLVPGGSAAGSLTSSASFSLDRPGLHSFAAHVADGRGGSAVATLAVEVRDPADDCASPWQISGDGPFPVTVVSSTAVGTVGPADPAPPCLDGSGGRDSGRAGSIWFELEPAESGRYTVATCGSTPDTVLSAWTGERCGPYLPVAGGCNDDDESVHCVGPRTDSHLELELEAGERYLFLVGGFDAAAVGQFQLTVDCERCLGGSDARTYLVAAASKTAGLNGTSWVTDLALYNPDQSPQSLRLAFLPKGTDNRGATEHQVEVGAGRMVEFADVVTSLFGARGSGAVRIRAPGELVVSSRTYNDAPAGTFGQSIPGVAEDLLLAPGGSARLAALDANAAFRTNLGIANGGLTPAAATIELISPAGATLASQWVDLEPLGWLQINDIFGDLGTGPVASASAVVRSQSAEARLLPYASVVDQQTGDPTYVAAGAEALPGVPLWVAAAAHTDGVGDSVWRTDLDLVNTSSVALDATIEFFQPRRDNTVRPYRVARVAAGASRRIADLVASLFGVEGSGALRISVDRGSLMVSSRTYNQAQSGTYGQAIPGVRESSAVPPGRRGALIQLRQDDRFRTNVGCVNLTGKQISVLAEYRDPDGALLGSKVYSLQPYGFHQDNGALPGGGAPTGYAILTSLTSGAGFFGYASVVDRGSDDPVFIPAAPLGP